LSVTNLIVIATSLN